MESFRQGLESYCQNHLGSHPLESCHPILILILYAEQEFHQIYLGMEFQIIADLFCRELEFLQTYFFREWFFHGLQESYPIDSFFLVCLDFCLGYLRVYKIGRLFRFIRFPIRIFSLQLSFHLLIDLKPIKRFFELL